MQDYRVWYHPEKASMQWDYLEPPFVQRVLLIYTAIACAAFFLLGVPFGFAFIPGLFYVMGRKAWLLSCYFFLAIILVVVGTLWGEFANELIGSFLDKHEGAWWNNLLVKLLLFQPYAFIVLGPSLVGLYCIWSIINWPPLSEARHRKLKRKGYLGLKKVTAKTGAMATASRREELTQEGLLGPATRRFLPLWAEWVLTTIATAVAIAGILAALGLLATVGLAVKGGL